MDDHQLEFAEREVQLVEKAYTYIITKKYPNDCSGNRKRIIRKKAQKFQVDGGELLYETDYQP